MVGAVLKGALISFSATGAATDMTAIPNVIVFQFNPETINHEWTAATTSAADADPRMNFSPLATSGVPGERFSFTLILDSDEQIADAGLDPIRVGLAEANGVYTRFAALEMLQFPVTSAVSAPGRPGLGRGQCGGARAAGVRSSVSVPVSEVPVVLFVWGPLRIVPVRVTAFDGQGNPLRRPAQSDPCRGRRSRLTVLTPDELAAVNGPMAKIASMAYNYTQGLRQAQAAANLALSAASILGMLPISL